MSNRQSTSNNKLINSPPIGEDSPYSSPEARMRTPSPISRTPSPMNRSPPPMLTPLSPSIEEKLRSTKHAIDQSRAIRNIEKTTTKLASDWSINKGSPFWMEKKLGRLSGKLEAGFHGLKDDMRILQQENSELKDLMTMLYRQTREQSELLRRNEMWLRQIHDKTSGSFTILSEESEERRTAMSQSSQNTVENSVSSQGDHELCAFCTDPYAPHSAVLCKRLFSLKERTTFVHLHNLCKMCLRDEHTQNATQCSRQNQLCCLCRDKFLPLQQQTVCMHHEALCPELGRYALPISEDRSGPSGSRLAHRIQRRY